ncbi:TRAPP II complex [Radiomyces spectabilis]|uniref:TRAPP II complex n=1 Tax=Radiomyces spectabilis TaxID=64574 RepID=UPI00221FFACE|nr:TRAPP II complex [Radiomyces spectabilis]KAI8373047.1 TRAPP II complex [Radiomyces spectabilis]
MDLAINITSSCGVRVLLVPVSPIKKSTFWKHVELVKKFSVVRLGDVTPDLQKGAGAKFSSQVFQEGQMHFQFMTTYKRDHAHLEDFQPHRRIFGVIGIMDCQEWNNGDLSEGYRRFVETLDQYPTAIATRCFAFDPNENQPDDTKGLIMIPNVGNMSFYMSTMICDFASEILSQFASIASRIEQLQALESPLPVGYAAYDMPKAAPQPSMSSPDVKSRTTSNYRASQPPVPTQSVSSSFLKRSSTTSANSRTTNKFSPMPPPTSPPLPSPSTTGASMSRSSSAQGIAASGDAGKTRRRTPGRIKKLLADFYLLAGRLPDAVEHYNIAIDMTKTTSDYLWLGSAMEGLVCATLLLEYLHADIGHFVSRSQSMSPMAPSSETSSMTSEPAGPPLEASAKSTVGRVVEQYTALLQYYGKVGSTTSMPMPALVYAEACAKMARFLLTVYVHGSWSENVLSLLVQRKLTNDTRLSGGHDRNHQPLYSDVDDLAKQKQSNIPRHEIAEWAMRIWSTRMEDVLLLDQIYLMNQMASVLSAIAYHRKAAWMMYESTNRMLPLLIQGRATLAASRDTSKRKIEEHDTGILQVLKTICEVYGIGERNVHDGGALASLDSEDGHARLNAGNKEQLRFGWAALQIDILRQCIRVAESLPDYASMLYYTTVLLKNLYQHISKEEQMRLASSIQDIVALGKRAGQVERSVNYWGVNIVSEIEGLQPISRKAVYQHPLLSKTVAAATKDNGDPFIYNPFAQKKNTKYQVTLVKNEVSEFKVTLCNPFGFDLELQHITLSTAGVPFSAIPTSANIPANGTLTLRMTGTPHETGVLIIRGCYIKIVGFAEQEFLVDVSHKLKSAEPKKRGQKDEDQSKDDFIKVKYSGLRAIQSGRKREASLETKPMQFYQLNVIDDQPLLKIKSTSLLHGAVMLYEGEMTNVSIDLENIGNIPVDFITLSFTDSTTLHPLPINPELPLEEQYEIELFIKGMHVFSWEGSTSDGHQQIGKKIWLPPGDHMELVVNVFGKRGCTGGTIQVDYGYLDRAVLKQDSNTETVESASTVTADNFYTRQLYLPVLLTVYQNLEPLNWDVLYLRHSGLVADDVMHQTLSDLRGLKLDSDHVFEQPVEKLLLVTQQMEGAQQDRNDYCLVTLDVRNIWTIPFNIEMILQSEDDEDPIKSVVTIQPGSTKRLLLPMKRLFLTPDECLESIPSLEPNRQFVVSQAPKMPPEQEQARLKMFWYREHLLRRIKGVWRCSATGRQGLLNLRASLRLTPMQLSILEKEDIEFLIDVQGNSVLKAGHRQFSCQCNDFVTMHVSIRNRQVHPVKLILRVQPVQSYNDGAKEYDLVDKLLMQGLPQVVLREIPANDTVTHSIPLCFLSRGRFEFLYHVEDVHTRQVYYDHDWTILHVQ